MVAFIVDLKKQSRQSSILVDTMSAFNLIQNVQGPTRITKSTETCIDHVYLETVSPVENINTGISDHMAQVLEIEWRKERTDRARYEWKRLMNDQTIEYLNLLLLKETWEDVYQTEDPNEAIVNFMSTFQYHFNSACPLQLKKIKEQPRSDNQWYDKELKDLRDLIVVLDDASKDQQIDIPEEPLKNLKQKYHNELAKAKKKP